MAHIRFENITKKFGTKTILDNMNLEIEDGSFTVMIAASQEAARINPPLTS